MVSACWERLHTCRDNDYDDEAEAMLLMIMTML